MRSTLSTNTFMRGSSSGYLIRAMLNSARWRSGEDMRMLPAPVCRLDDSPFLLGRDRRRRVPAALAALGVLAQMLVRRVVLQRPPESAVSVPEICVLIAHSAATKTGSECGLAEYWSMRSSIS